MNGVMMLYVSQYGHKYYARSVRELQRIVGGGRINKMYVDKTDGSTVHIGYVIGKQWLQAFSPVAKVVKIK